MVARAVDSRSSKFYGGAKHGFAVRTPPGDDKHAATRSFDEARRFLATHLR